MITGVDVSQFQGTINWNTLKNNANFAIIRSSYGNGYTDSQYVTNKSQARSVGILRGFYHYSYPEYNSPTAEADWFASKVSDLQQGELLALDFEEQYNDPVNWSKAFLDRVSSHFGGYKPLIYMNLSLSNSYDWSLVRNAGYKIWLAYWNFDPNNNNYSSSWGTAELRQWTDNESVPGISGAVDGDALYGSTTDFTNLGLHPSSPPPPPPPPSNPPPQPISVYVPPVSTPPVPPVSSNVGSLSSQLKQANSLVPNNQFLTTLLKELMKHP